MVDAASHCVAGNRPTVLNLFSMQHVEMIEKLDKLDLLDSFHQRYTCKRCFPSSREHVSLIVQIVQFAATQWTSDYYSMD